MGGEQFSLKDAVCNLTNDQKKERITQAFLDDGVQQLNNRIEVYVPLYVNDVYG